MASGLKAPSRDRMIAVFGCPPQAMDDDVFGTSIWNTPSYPPAITTTEQSISTTPSFSPQPSDDPLDSRTRFDDFDDFEAPTEAVEGREAEDDDFGDFGDFGDAEAVEGGTATDEFGFGQTPTRVPVFPLRLDPMPDKDELRRQVDELLGPMVGSIDWSIVTDEPIREREGPDQILVTPERLVSIASASRVRAELCGKFQ